MTSTELNKGQRPQSAERHKARRTIESKAPSKCSVGISARHRMIAINVEWRVYNGTKTY